MVRRPQKMHVNVILIFTYDEWLYLVAVADSRLLCVSQRELRVRTNLVPSRKVILLEVQFVQIVEDKLIQCCYAIFVLLFRYQVCGVFEKAQENQARS